MGNLVRAAPWKGLSSGHHVSAMPTAALQPPSTQAAYGLKTDMQRGTPLGHERHYAWKAEGRRSEASSPPHREDRDRLASNHTDTDSIEAEKVPTASEATRQSASKKRPRPTTAPGLRATRGGAAPVHNVEAYHEPALRHGFSMGKGSGDRAGPLLQTIQPEGTVTGSYDANSPTNMNEAEDSDDLPSGQGEESEHSASPWNQGSGTPLSACLQSGAGEDDSRPQIPRHRMTAAKMMVRSGLRCRKCFLKAWVCLCDRAPRELKREETRSAQSESYMPASDACTFQTDPILPSAGCELALTRLGQGGPSSTCWRARSSAWRASKPARKRAKPARASDPHGSQG